MDSFNVPTLLTSIEKDAVVCAVMVEFKCEATRRRWHDAYSSDTCRTYHCFCYISHSGKVNHK